MDQAGLSLPACIFLSFLLSTEDRVVWGRRRRLNLLQHFPLSPKERALQGGGALSISLSCTFTVCTASSAADQTQE